LGDTIQMCRYAAVLRGAGAKVSLMVQRPLVRLLSANLPWATVVEDQPQREKFGAAARRRAMDLSWSRCSDRWEAALVNAGVRVSAVEPA